MPVQIRFVGRRDSGHLFDIFRRLFLQDVDDVVDGDDADESVFLVDDGHAQKVVVFNDFGHFFLVIHGPDEDELFVVVHDVPDEGVRGVIDEVGQFDGPDEVPGGIDAVDRVDGDLVLAGGADVTDGVPHRHAVVQGDHLVRHDAAGGVLRVVEERIDLFACVRTRDLQDTGDDVGRHFLEEVDHVIEVQIVDEVAQFLVRDARDDALLVVRFQIGEDFRGDVFREDAEHLDHVFGFQFLQEVGDVDFIPFSELFSKTGEVSGGQHGELCFIGSFFHKNAPLIHRHGNERSAHCSLLQESECPAMNGISFFDRKTQRNISIRNVHAVHFLSYFLNW